MNIMPRYLSTSKAKRYFKELDVIDEQHWVAVKNLEQTMKLEIGIKDLEFIWVDGLVVGIGTPWRKKKIPLIHRS